MFFDFHLGVPENYPFVVHKEIASLIWMRLNCPSARLILRADDTVLVDTFLLLNYLENELDLEQQDGIHGWFRPDTPVARSGIRAVTNVEYKWDSYPPHARIPGYFFSNDTCRRLVDAAQGAQPTWIRTGNAYITGLLRHSARIPFYNYTQLRYLARHEGLESCDESFETKSNLLLCQSKLSDGLQGDPYEYYDVWDILLAKHSNSTL